MEPAHFQTLHWLLRTGIGRDSPRLLEWCSKQWGVFWIQGRPASRKSTAMKFLLRHPRVKESLNTQAGDVRWKLAGIFFTDRLGQMERSWKAVLASMLYQLVSEIASLKEMLVPLRKGGKNRNFMMPELDKEITTAETLYDWDIPSLQNALLFFKNQQSVHFKICYFIDALDENDEEEYSRRNVTEFLLKLASASTDAGCGVFKICAASRPENDLSELLSPSNGFKIHEWTRPDIEAYVHDKLGQHPPMGALVLSDKHGIRKRAKDLMAQIVDKAQGVFLWVRLIVGDLCDSLTNGLALNIDDLEIRLGETPEELQEFYVLILKRILPKFRLDSYTIFECVLRAQRPLTLLDLWMVLESRKQSDSHNTSNSFSSFSDEQIGSILASGPGLERRIKTCSGGLLEVRSELISRPKRYSMSSRERPDDSSPDKYSDHELLERRQLADSPEREDPFISDRGIQEVNISSCTVQVLHQTVREFLSKSSNLLPILNGGKERSESMNAVESADYSFLRTFLFWLRIPEAQQLYLLDQTRAYVEKYFFEHAHKADKFKIQSYVGILDEIDNAASLKYGTCSWPSKIANKRHIISSWPQMDANRHAMQRYVEDFLGFAVHMGLSHYVEQRLEKEPSLVLGDLGLPLLHIAVDFQTRDRSTMEKMDTDMLKILLRFGANVEDVYVGKNALERLLSSSLTHKDVSSGVFLQGLLPKRLSLLLQYGANPNQMIDNVPCLLILLNYVLDEGEAFSMIKCLVEYGANLEVADERWGRFIDVALSKERDLAAFEWIWLFNHGLRIHAEPVAKLYSDEFKNHTLRTKSCRNSAFYTPAARLKARKFNPQWNFAEKYLPVPSLPGSSKASSPSRKSRRL